MRKARDRRHMSVDIEHMRRLHQEAFEQLELMRTALQSANESLGTMRDLLDDMTINHWNSYLDVLHMIAMHDEILAGALSKHGMTRDNDDAEDISQETFGNRQLFELLLVALIRRHRRFYDEYGWRGNPMSDYLKESMAMEREHIAELNAMIQDIM